MQFVKEDFVCKHGFYYVGHVVSEAEWVDEEQIHWERNSAVIHDVRVLEVNGWVLDIVAGI